MSTRYKSQAKKALNSTQKKLLPKKYNNIVQ